jgi:ribose transport system substrate-binding protein
VRSAIAAKADGIILVSIDCAAVKSPLQAARRAGIKIFGFYGIDCDDELGGTGRKQFDGQVDYGNPSTAAAATRSNRHGPARFARCPT